ncbi:wd-40 repeat protein [Stylonychia lemnae]|uniref:Wd-40 repeat protein n=1 Tax=Stylonychia lemnae TaxID=5949 RepID=A0A078AYM6_STYLE|nr:wd-40 repeat protein [Stylonychia lemnae]|eukprot:CDW86317.1 wd-40 repeat protein [Stylonychia lemnae]
MKGLLQNLALHTIIGKQVKLLKKEYQEKNFYQNRTQKIFEHYAYIPFLKNFEGQSLLDLFINAGNIQGLEILFNVLRFDDFDNHSRTISAQLPQVLMLKLKNIYGYFESRILETEQLKSTKRGKLNCLHKKEYAITSGLQWPNMNKLEGQIFKDKTGKNHKFEIKLTILDIPRIHDFQTQECKEFLEALVFIDDIKMFENQAIQSLINIQWTIARKQTVKYLCIPFLFYLCVFCFYSNYLNTKIGKKNLETEDFRLICFSIILLLMISTFFLINESSQVFKQGKNYFYSFWNYSDLSPPILVTIVMIFHILEVCIPDFESPIIIMTIHSFASMLVWFKFIYLLRIFQQTGYLINMLTKVAWDMRIFMLILLIFYLSFTEAFLRITEFGGEEVDFTYNYAYALVYTFRLSIGDTDVDKFDLNDQSFTAWFLFVFCTLISNVIMLNLLIAIISKTFESVTENSNSAGFQEKAKIIFENQYLIREQRKQEFCEKDSYIIVGREVQQIQGDNDDNFDDIIENQSQQEYCQEQFDEDQNENESENLNNDLSDENDPVEEANDSDKMDGFVS